MRLTRPSYALCASGPPRSGPSPLAQAVAGMKTDASAAGLTDAGIDAELAAYNAERRDLRADD